jgi:hypothetical protein
MSVPTYRTNILHEICYDKVRMSGLTYSERIRKSLAANGTVACSNPTAGADVRTDVKGHAMLTDQQYPGQERLRSCADPLDAMR